MAQRVGYVLLFLVWIPTGSSAGRIASTARTRSASLAGAAPPLLPHAHDRFATHSLSSEPPSVLRLSTSAAAVRVVHVFASSEVGVAPARAGSKQASPSGHAAYHGAERASSSRAGASSTRRAAHPKPNRDG